MPIRPGFAGPVVAGGQAKLAGKIFRLGHMGWVQDADMDAALDAVRRALADLGFVAPADSLARSRS